MAARFDAYPACRIQEWLYDRGAALRHTCHFPVTEESSGQIFFTVMIQITSDGEGDSDFV